LPLLPEQEIIRQIKLNQEILFKYFKIKPTGFYLPEMAYSLESAKIIKKLGFDWIILDQISTTQKIDDKILYQIKNLGLKVVFRNREYSQKLSS
jgi:alpha-amylase/alpha-mannosidase (GH57 family)